MSADKKRFRLITRSDFDGLVCAVLLQHLDLIDEIKFVAHFPLERGGNDDALVKIGFIHQPLVEDGVGTRHGGKERVLIGNAIIQGRWIKKDGKRVFRELVEFMQCTGNTAEHIDLKEICGLVDQDRA